MTIKYFNEEDGNYYDVTGTTGSSLVIGASGFQVKNNPKVYSVSITQKTTDNPYLEDTYQNDFGSIDWSRDDEGIYNGYLKDGFNGNFPFQSFLLYQINLEEFCYATIEKINSDNIRLKTYNTGYSLRDERLLQSFFQFIMY